MNRNKFTQRSMILTRLARVAGLIIVIVAIVGLSQSTQPALAQSPRIVASIAGDWFWTTDFAPNAPLLLSIFDSQGGNLLWSDSRTADEWGFVLVGFEDHGIDLIPDYYLVVSDGSSEKALVLETITMEFFDTHQDFMAGTAPPSRPVWVSAGTQFDQTGMWATVDLVSGVWTAEFSTIPFDITEAMRPWSFAQIFDDDDDANEASPPPPPVWRDEFDGPLDESWYWVRENPDKWGFIDGFLRIFASPYPTGGETGGENLLLRPVAPGDFIIKTRLLFEPDTNFQFAGLVIWQDESNFLQFGRAFCDLEGLCVGNGIYFDKILGGNLTDSNFATPVDSPNEAYLRLERRGDMVRAFFSYEGTSWYEIGTHWIPADFQVNGVGLTASQDYNTTDWDIPADFDFFELSEGWGFLPEGFHDHDQGDVPSWACNAGGWAADPDDRAARLNVEIVVDHETIATPIAEEFRQDLLDAGVCEGGNCGFFASLWGSISSYEPHSVATWAQDSSSGEWVLLNNSPKDITCRTYDIYAYDPMTGETKQISNLRDSDEYDPSWSQNGKMVAHDVVRDDFHGIYITDVKTGVSAPLAGAEDGGNDADWSPNGKWIAFDRRWVEDPSLYVVPSTGGIPTLVRSNAVRADWAPNGKRLVFQDSDGSIRTVAVDGGSGRETLIVERGETLIAPNGTDPAWSPDGNWIAYEFNGDIWIQRVNIQGTTFGDPIQVTSLEGWAVGGPTWSIDSQTIIFNAGVGRDIDLWAVPAMGGEITWFTGAPEFGDYGPENARNSSNVAYASFSPAGQAARLWVAAYTYDPPAGTFGEGTHPYHFEFEWSLPEPGSWSGQGGELVISSDAASYDGYVLLRGPEELRGINYPGGMVCEEVGEINPGQPTRFLVGWLPDYGEINYPDAKEHFESITARAVWGDGMSAELAPHEIIPFRWDDWFQYVCTFTEAPPRMDLRVNYGHEWVESFYEAGHQVELTVTEADGITVKATATVFTEPKDFWGGATGFQTTPEDWSPAPPDLQPYDWVYAQVDNGATAQVQLGEISGMIDLDADSLQGTIYAPWFSNEVNVECHPWGSPEPVDMKFDSVLPDGEDAYSCSWAGEWDIQYYQDVGVGYFGPDGHWVANAFRVLNPHFMVFPEWEWFDGLDWPDGAVVTVTVETKSECMVTKASWGGFFNGSFGEGCDVVIDDIVTFTDGDTTRTHTVQSLAITSVDEMANTVAGIADAYAEVHVWPHATGEQVLAIADGAGAWLADFTGMFDLAPGECGRAEIRDLVGNATAVDWCVPSI